MNEIDQYYSRFFAIIFYSGVILFMCGFIITLFADYLEINLSKFAGLLWIIGIFFAVFVLIFNNKKIN